MDGFVSIGDEITNMLNEIKKGNIREIAGTITIKCDVDIGNKDGEVFLNVRCTPNVEITKIEMGKKGIIMADLLED
ncbi:MAG: hypothetical protein GXO39_01650 [Thermotogae bacterium]|nr:hypothetical protein [Thermotogota bacterium]